jgi:hypothetical protein
MAGGLATLSLLYAFRVLSGFGVFVSVAGTLLVATLLAVVVIGLIPAKGWEWLPTLPAIPDGWLPYLFFAGLAVGFLFGWLFW